MLVTYDVISTENTFHFVCEVWHEEVSRRTKLQNNASKMMWSFISMEVWYRWLGVILCFSYFLLFIASTVHMLVISHKLFMPNLFRWSFPHIQYYEMRYVYFYSVKIKSAENYSVVTKLAVKIIVILSTLLIIFYKHYIVLEIKKLFLK